MRPISGSSRGNRNPTDPAQVERQRRERLIEQTLETQRRRISRAVPASR